MSVLTTTAPAVRPRRTALVTTAAGATFVVVPLLVELVTNDAFELLGVGLLLLLAALPGLHRLQTGRDGAAGRWGLRAMLAGIAAMVLLVLTGDLLDAALSGTAQSVVESAYLVVGGTAVLAALGGIVAFSIGMTRARVLAASGIWVFLGGMTLGLVSETFEQSLRGPVPWLADVLPPTGFVVAGVGLLLLGRSASTARGC